MDGITIKPDGKGRLRVTFPFSKARIEQIKRIPGRRWLPDDKAWSGPDTPEVREALADLRTTRLPCPATTSTVAPHQPGQFAPHKTPTTSTPGQPLTTHPPHPFVKAVDDELVLRGMAYGTRKSYGQHLRNYFVWLKVKPEEATREDIRALLMVAYSAGLRVDEMMRLKVSDIDSKRMQIRVTAGKGAKDRYTHVTQKAAGRIESPLDIIQL